MRTSEQIEQMIEELRDQYTNTADPHKRAVIAARGKALGNALTLMKTKMYQ